MERPERKDNNDGKYMSWESKENFLLHNNIRWDIIIGKIIADYDNYRCNKYRYNKYMEVEYGYE